MNPEAGHCRETPFRAGTCPRRCRNYRLPTNLLMHTVNRLSSGTTESSCPATIERTLIVDADDTVRRCRNNRLRTNLFVCAICRLRGRRGHVPTLQRRVRIMVLYTYRRKIDCRVASLLAMTGLPHPCHCEALAPWQSCAGTTDCIPIRSCLLSAAYAVGGDMSPNYRGAA